MGARKFSIKEVGPRDGLQNEKEIISTEKKIQWIDMLSETGLEYIEVTSFVSRKWIPQLADALEVSKGIRRHEGVTYAALVPNLKGLEGALEANIDEVSVFLSASETHNRKNINKSINETIPVLESVIKDAAAAGKNVRSYISTVFGCPYEGAVSVQEVARITEKLLEAGVYEISLGDTIGIANPAQVEQVLRELMKHFGKERFALHFHDTRGMGLANVLRSVDMGFDKFDSSLGGLGGCPYAPGATGNIATDDLVYMLEAMGGGTGVDLNALKASASYIQNQIRKPLRSHQMQIPKTVDV